MKNMVDCFFPIYDWEKQKQEIKKIASSSIIQRIYLGVFDNEPIDLDAHKYSVLKIDDIYNTGFIYRLSRNILAPYLLIHIGNTPVKMELSAIERMVRIAWDNDSLITYSDYYIETESKKIAQSTIDYQKGSIRGDFNFGPIRLFNTKALQKAVSQCNIGYKYAGWYEIRLRIAQQQLPIHVNEYLYSALLEHSQSSDKQLPQQINWLNRFAQQELENACTNYLKETGCYLTPEFKPIRFIATQFRAEASIILSVYNCIDTITETITRVLAQKCDYDFNIIVIDNHSTDGTTERISQFTDNKQVIHIVPEDRNSSISNGWNIGISHEQCGQFAIKPENKDILQDNRLLQKIITTFHAHKCGMILGLDSNTEDITNSGTGLQYHEWTRDNGLNNILRINQPRNFTAYYTPLARETKIPDTDYDSEYTTILKIAREYQVSILHNTPYNNYQPFSLNNAQSNANNFYKDRIRTWELEARYRINNKKEEA